MEILKKYNKISLLKKLLVAMILGILLGAIFGPNIEVIKPFGTVFLNLLKMAALPLILVNLISGIASLDNPKSFGRIGGKIILYYFATTAVAIVLGLLVGFLFKPGEGFQLSGSYDEAIQSIPSVGATLINLIPTNIFSALTAGSLDQIVVFSAFCGIAILMLPDPHRSTLRKGVNALAAMFNKLVSIVMIYAPIGVCALMACTVGTYGENLFGFLAKYLGASYFAAIIHVCFYLLLLVLFTGANPLKFLKKATPLMVATFSTSSSLACVPVNLECADDLGCSRGVSNFTIPLGSQINKDGNGIMLAITFLFASQCVGGDTSIATLIRVIFISLILTTGAGGVPGGGIVTIAIIVDAFGLPLEVVALVSGIFTLIDVVFTTMNSLGDLVGTYIVDFSEKKRAKKLTKA
ncbi:MAG: dicarboxylate/amino acid:cation symporter [Coriobacteriia bacterium]|nr:dicarboxylate/amino acid:cation symporter [Coriobacteriia bacterium]